MAELLTGGAIVGSFVVFGILSVVLYGPWRRRVDRERAQMAYFEPLRQDSSAGLDEEDPQPEELSTNKGKKNAGVTVKPVENTDAAGPVGVGAAR